MSDAQDPSDSAERAAILARRERFVARTLDGVEILRGDAAARAGRRTKLAALAIGGLAIACPCLKVAPPDTGEEDEGPMPDLPEESDAATGSGGDTDAESGDAGAAPDPAGGEIEHP